MTHRMRQCWQDGRPALGTFVFSHDPASTEIVGHAGFDFSIIDMEHTTLTATAVEQHVRAANAAGCTALVRMAPEMVLSCGRLLDAGAHGILMSHFGCDPELSRAYAQVLRYAPQGNRPSCSGVRAAVYGLRSYAETVAAANRDVVGIALVEDVEAIGRLGELLPGSGLDAVMPGPGDISTSMGLAGQPTHPRVRAAIEEIIRAARRAGLRVGMYLNSPEELAVWQPQALDFYVYLFDLKIYARAYADAAAALRKDLGTLPRQG